MQPVRLDAVNPGTLAGQAAGDDPDTRALLPDRSVVVADPSTYLFADMPGGVIPDHEQRLLVQLGQLVAAPSQVLRGNAADRTAIDKTQPDLFGQGVRRRGGRNRAPVALG